MIVKWTTSNLEMIAKMDIGNGEISVWPTHFEYSRGIYLEEKKLVGFQWQFSKSDSQVKWDAIRIWRSDALISFQRLSMPFTDFHKYFSPRPMQHCPISAVVTTIRSVLQDLTSSVVRSLSLTNRNPFLVFKIFVVDFFLDFCVTSHVDLRWTKI